MPTSDPRPNILFVFSDEHRWCSLPNTEMPELQAPNFTSFASQGITFETCMSNNPVCMPYRAMLETGLWPHHNTAVANGLFFNERILGLDRPTIAQTFRDGGYVTGYVGKWHLRDSTCATVGYDWFIHWKFGDDHWNTDWRRVHEDPERWETCTDYNAVSMTDQALAFMEEHKDGEKPFLLMLSWNPPHYRWDDAPDEFLALYPEGMLSVRPNAPAEMTRNAQYRHYHAHISAIDHEFGRLLNQLDEMGLTGNTVVIYTSDHGSGWRSNDFWSKPHPIDEVARVPFFARWPGQIPAGESCPSPLGTIDLYPTLCGLAGIEVPSDCQGLNLSHLLLGRGGPAPDAQLLLHPANPLSYFRLWAGQAVAETAQLPFRGIRTERYTYGVRESGDWILFDNRKDPFQMNNLVDDPDHREIKRTLRCRLEEMVQQAEGGAPYLPQHVHSLPLEERIAAENEFYCLKWSEEQWRGEQAKVLGPLLEQATDDHARDRIQQLASEVYDREFEKRFGYYRLSLHSFWRVKDPNEWSALKGEMEGFLTAKAGELHQRAAALI